MASNAIPFFLLFKNNINWNWFLFQQFQIFGKISFDNGFVFNKLGCFCIIAISLQG